MQIDTASYPPDVLIVGSGAGGATLARELSRRGKSVLVVERGKPEERIGTTRDSLRYYDVNKLTQMPITSKEGVILWRAFMAGGTTVISCGNATRALEGELAELGIDLAPAFAELEAELCIAPTDEALLSAGSERIRQAAQALGYTMVPMPKFVAPASCTQCGQCVLGCQYASKWTARTYLDEAQQHGAAVLYETRVQKVHIENGHALGVYAVGPRGAQMLHANIVILAAGGLGTPVILQQSGFREHAGQGLFVDLFVNTYGVTQDVNQIAEPTMALVLRDFHEARGFILSPYANHTRLGRFIEAGMAGMTLPPKRTLGIMTKIVDEGVGYVAPDGSVSKPVTERDAARLREGSDLAADILVEAGAERTSIVVSKAQGAHPGGTAAIGKVVDRDLRTHVDNLYVCDSSVLPTAPGLPPIMTIAALAKRLAKTLAP